MATMALVSRPAGVLSKISSELHQNNTFDVDIIIWNTILGFQVFARMSFITEPYSKATHSLGVTLLSGLATHLLAQAFASL